MSGSGDAGRRRGAGSRMGLHASFDGPSAGRVSSRRGSDAAGGLKAPAPRREQGERASQPGSASPEKEWDPWAEDEPVFGPRGIRHALSGRPGTPPCGNLAVPGPSGAEAPPAGGAPRPLVSLARAVRVEIELGACGRWTCGLVERASPVGFEATLGGRSVGTRDFLQAGRRVRVLVSMGSEPAFVAPARILWVDPPADPGGAVRAQLALETSDPAALSRWEEVVGRARG